MEGFWGWLCSVLRCASRYEPGRDGLDEGFLQGATASGQARWLVNLSWIIWIILDPKTLGFLWLKCSRCFGLVLLHSCRRPGAELLR